MVLAGRKVRGGRGKGGDEGMSDRYGGDKGERGVRGRLMLWGRDDFDFDGGGRHIVVVISFLLQVISVVGVRESFAFAKVWRGHEIEGEAA